MTMPKTIVYIGSFLAPLDDAIAKRAVGIGMIFQMLGYSFRMIGESKEVLLGKISNERDYGGMTYCTLHRAVNATEHFRYSKDIKQIKRKLIEWRKREKICAVILCGTKCALMANGIVNFCKMQKIPLIVDSMDWLNSHTGNTIFDLVKNIDTWVEINYVNKRANGVICISRYLSDYYSKSGLRTIVIPPVSPYKKTKLNIQNSIPQIVYAGVPCRLDQPLVDPNDAKDRLDIIIEILFRLYKKRIPFIFYVFGLTKEQYDLAFPKQKQMVQELVQSRAVTFFGRVKDNVVREYVEKSDYTILLRNRNRISQAGFSTKLSESIAIGTPVITNDTSDILIYVQDNYDAIIVDIDKIDEIERRIEMSLCDEVNLKRLKHNVRKNQCFSPQSYVDRLKRFIEEI